MATGDRRDPYRSFNFELQIDGIPLGAFSECSGLTADCDAVEYREGTDKLTARKLPGLNKYSNISLKWGVTDDKELWDWRKKTMDGKVERKNGSVVLLDDAGAEKVRWNFTDGWPTKWTGPSFNATSNDVAIETLDIAHEGLEKA